MAVDWISPVRWGPWGNSGVEQFNYYRFPFAGAPHIIATAYLDQVSLGTVPGSNTAGTAIAAFKRFEFLDDQGVVQETELTVIESWIDVPRCVSITIAFDLEAAFATAGWTFYSIS
jgi:hypothetical protein